MVNDRLHFQNNLLEASQQAATRDGLGSALLALGESDPRVVVLCADLAESTRTLAFKEKYPERYVELGVAEQNLATVASGMAAAGKRPFIASYATFSPGRNNEQIRTTMAINKIPVVICGMHAGVSVGPDGATHQALEDMALMRAMPNMTVISPCDAHEAHRACLAATKIDGPVYIRFVREKTPVMTTPETPFELGTISEVWGGESPEVAIFATGPLLFEALKAARELESQGIDSVVANVHTIKPLDTEAIASLARECGAVVTVEEHQIAGGLGSAVAEALAQTHPVPMEFIGVHDRFGQSGTPSELLREYGLDSAAIIEAALHAVARKS